MTYEWLRMSGSAVLHLVSPVGDRRVALSRCGRAPRYGASGWTGGRRSDSRECSACKRYAELDRTTA